MAAWSLFSKLKDGISGGDGPPKLEAYPLHLYGKLPIYKDFITSGFTEEGSKDFRDWLGNGFSRRWSLLEEYKGVEIPLHTFLFALPGGKRSVAGALWGSHDEGGLRQFPFTLFAVVPQGRAVADPFVALSYLDVFEERAAHIRRNFRQGRTVSSFYESFRGARIEVPVKKPAKIAEGVEKEARGVTLGDFAESLLGSSALADWPRFISRLKSSCASSGGAGAVRLPIGNLLPAELQVQTWLSWLSREGAFEGATPVGSLVSRAGGRSRAVLFFRDLRPEDFLLLHPEATDYEFVEETTTVSGAAGEPGAPEEAAAEPPAAPPSQPGWNEPLTAFLHPEKGEA